MEVMQTAGGRQLQSNNVLENHRRFGMGHGSIRIRRLQSGGRDDLVRNTLKVARR
jgi:hypothetical protein